MKFGRIPRYTNEKNPRPCKTVGCENDRLYYTGLCKECHISSRQFKRDKKLQSLIYNSGLKLSK